MPSDWKWDLGVDEHKEKYNTSLLIYKSTLCYIMISVYLCSETSKNILHAFYVKTTEKGTNIKYVL